MKILIISPSIDSKNDAAKILSCELGLRFDQTSSSDIITHISLEEEFQAKKSLFDVIIWIEKLIQPVNGAFNIEYDKKSMYIVKHNGTKNQLKNDMEHLINFLRMKIINEFELIYSEHHEELASKIFGVSIDK